MNGIEMHGVKDTEINKKFKKKKKTFLEGAVVCSMYNIYLNKKTFLEVS